MKLLVSAGPTQEPIDDVRFITNASSGRMGLELAKAASKKGHKVTVVLGPVPSKPMLGGIRVVEVRSADEMADAVLKELAKGFDAFISAAAVGDYAPEKKRVGKVCSGEKLVLRLKPTRKITSLAKKTFPNVFVVAFKAEFNVPAETLVDRAFRKLSGENLDLVLANDIGRNRMGSPENEVYVVDGKRRVRKLGVCSKTALAGKIMKVVEKALDGG